MRCSQMPMQNPTSNKEPDLSPLLTALDAMEIPQTTEEEVAAEDAEFAPAMVDGKLQ